MSVVVLGTVALDTVKTPYGRRSHILGGSAAHFAMSARLFTPVDLVAVIGDDFPGRYLYFLRKKGINLDSVIKENGPTFQWEGEYKKDLNVAITLKTELGVLASFRPHIRETQRNIRHIFLANVDPDIQRHLLGRMRSAQLIGLDSMNYWIDHKRRSLLSLLKKVHIYVANDQEARSLSAENNLLKAARCLCALGPRMVLIKKGEHGTLFYSKSFIFLLPAYPVERVIDPTGAGDTFAGGFMGYLAKSRSINQASIKKAIAYGTIAASFNVEGFGLERSGSLRIEELERRLAGFKRLASFK
ncbi:MAG: PfkB family carbohydrate kinase [Candidatus Omnitrophota bacterium]